MNHFLNIAGYLLHPLIMPFLGTLLYFSITPRYLEPELMISKLIAVLIITVLIPLIIFFLLKNLNLVSSIHLEAVKERKYPLMLQCLLFLLIIKMVFNPYDFAEMYYFFVGILFSVMTALLLVFVKFKISLHQMAIAGVTMFLIALSVHFEINMLLGISFFIFGNGWIASSRLHTKSHTLIELIIGFFIGVIPQFILINFWL
jgi:hypothetical protein